MGSTAQVTSVEREGRSGQGGARMGLAVGGGKFAVGGGAVLGPAAVVASAMIDGGIGPNGRDGRVN